MTKLRRKAPLRYRFMLSVTPEDAEHLRREAAREDLALSTWARRVLLQHLKTRGAHNA